MYKVRKAARKATTSSKSTEDYEPLVEQDEIPVIEERQKVVFIEKVEEPLEEYLEQPVRPSETLINQAKDWWNLETGNLKYTRVQEPKEEPKSQQRTIFIQKVESAPDLSAWSSNQQRVIYLKKSETPSEESSSLSSTASDSKPFSELLKEAKQWWNDATENKVPTRQRIIYIAKVVKVEEPQGESPSNKNRSKLSSAVFKTMKHLLKDGQTTFKQAAYTNEECV